MLCPVYIHLQEGRLMQKFLQTSRNLRKAAEVSGMSQGSVRRKVKETKTTVFSALTDTQTGRRLHEPTLEN
jgi:hypothetical protein